MLTRRSTLALLAGAGAATLLARPALAKPAVFQDGGAAIRGTDPVAYFTQSKAVAGDPAITSTHGDAVWRFASAAHKAMFDADPEKYAPKYGGYCAYAVSKGATAPTDPDAWTIHDGRLYLNYSVNVREIWKQDMDGNIRKADANWPGVLA